MGPQFVSLQIALGQIPGAQVGSLNSLDFVEPIPPAIIALQHTVAELAARVAQLEAPPAQWLPLKAAAHDAGVAYETARKWAERGLIEARREGKRWLVNMSSLLARKERLAG